MLRTLKNLQGVGVLSKEAQKKIIGGYTCFAQHPNGTSINGFVGTFEQAYAAAKAYAQDNGVHFCCSSCGKATWMQPYLEPVP